MINTNDGGRTTATNLEYLSSIIPRQYLKIKPICLMKDLREENDYLINRKCSYVSIPLDKVFRKHIRFQRKENLCEILFLPFYLGPGSLIFIKR